MGKLCRDSSNLTPLDFELCGNRSPTDRFGTILTLVKAAFLFLYPEDALDSGWTPIRPPRNKQIFILSGFKNTYPIMRLQGFSLTFFLSVADQGQFGQSEPKFSFISSQLCQNR
jgi:hypothetical protein